MSLAGGLIMISPRSCRFTMLAASMLLAASLLASGALASIPEVKPHCASLVGGDCSTLDPLSALGSPSLRALLTDLDPAWLPADVAVEEPEPVADRPFSLGLGGYRLPTEYRLFPRPPPRRFALPEALPEAEVRVGGIDLGDRLQVPENKRFSLDLAVGHSEDPLGDVDSPNLYGYVRMSPFNGVDPTGELCVGKLRETAVCRWITDKMVRFLVGDPEARAEAEIAHRAFVRQQRVVYEELTGEAPRENTTIYFGEGGMRLKGDGAWVDASGRANPTGHEYFLVPIAVGAGQAGVRAVAGGATSREAFVVVAKTAGDDAVGEVVGVSPVALLAAPKMIRHHIFNKFRGKSPKSQKYREFFKKHGIKVDEYTVEIPEAMHKEVHGAGQNWTTRWKRWIDENPDATTEEVFQFGGALMDEYGLSDFNLVHYRAPR